MTFDDGSEPGGFNRVAIHTQFARTPSPEVCLNGKTDPAGVSELVLLTKSRERILRSRKISQMTPEISVTLTMPIFSRYSRAILSSYTEALRFGG